MSCWVKNPAYAVIVKIMVLQNQLSSKTNFWINSLTCCACIFFITCERCTSTVRTDTSKWSAMILFKLPCIISLATCFSCKHGEYVACIADCVAFHTTLGAEYFTGGLLYTEYYTVYHRAHTPVVAVLTITKKPKDARYEFMPVLT